VDWDWSGRLWRWRWRWTVEWRFGSGVETVVFLAVTEASRVDLPNGSSDLTVKRGECFLSGSIGSMRRTGISVVVKDSIKDGLAFGDLDVREIGRQGSGNSGTGDSVGAGQVGVTTTARHVNGNVAK
jgi:hypothetical protein